MSLAIPRPNQFLYQPDFQVILVRSLVIPILLNLPLNHQPRLYSILHHVTLLGWLLHQLPFPLPYLLHTPLNLQRFSRLLQPSLNQTTLINSRINEYSLDGLELFRLDQLQSHIVVFIVYWFVDLVVDYDLVLSVPAMQEDTIIISAFHLFHKIFAILNGSKENS